MKTPSCILAQLDSISQLANEYEEINDLEQKKKKNEVVSMNLVCQSQKMSTILKYWIFFAITC